MGCPGAATSNDAATGAVGGFAGAVAGRAAWRASHRLGWLRWLFWVFVDLRQRRLVINAHTLFNWKIANVSKIKK